MTRSLRLALLATSAWIVIGAGAAQAADAAAAAAPTDVAGLVVTAPREEVVARDRQRDAPNLVSVQSIETILKYPDFNAAEALSRIPGVSLSTDTGEGRFVNIRGIDANLNGATYGGVVLLNTNAGGTAAGGGGRAVEFDTIPTGAIDGIVVTKTRLPEQEGEGLGGVIELTPRSAANITRPFADVTLGWGYEPLHDHTGPFNAEIAVGARFGLGQPGAWVSNAQPFSFVLNASRRDDRRAIDDLEESYIDDTGAPNKSDAGIQGKAFSGVDFRRYDYHRRRFGYGGEFDFQPNDDHAWYLRASVAGYTEAVHKNFYLLRNLDGAEQADGSVPRAPDGSFLATAQPQITLTDEQETHRNQVYVIGGRDRFGALQVDYRAAYSRATFQVGYNIGARFVAATTAVAYSNANADFPSFSYPSGFNPDVASQYNMNRLTNTDEHDVDEEWSGAANLQTPLHLVGDNDLLRLGFEVRQRDKTVDPFVWNGIVRPPGANLAAGLSGPANVYYDGHYTNGPFIDRYQIRAVLARQAGTVTNDLDQGGFFTAQEDIYAGYVQYTADIGKWNVLAGVRVEGTDAAYTAFQTTTDAAGNDTTDLVTRTNDYINAFPTVQVRYNFAPDLVARAIFSTGIARPGFNQVAAASSVDFSNSPVVISRGNPALKPITGWNVDLSLEYYMPEGGILSVALFDKEFDNYIVQRVQHGVTNDPLAPGELADVTTFLNVNDAYARGIEVDYHQKYSFLPAPFDGLGIDANATFVDSHILEYDAATSSTGTNQSGLLPGTSKVTWNVAGFYEAHGVQVRLAAQYVSHSLFGLGGDKALDVIQDDRTTLDLTSSYQVNPELQVYFNVKNLLDTPLRYYEGSPNRPIQREFYDVTYEGGVRAKF